MFVLIVPKRNLSFAKLCVATPPDTEMDCEAPVSEPISSTSGVNSVLKIPPPKKKTSHAGKTASGKLNINTLDNFVSKESPSCKRKLSDDPGSPSSAYVQKSTGTDGANVVS